MQDFFTSRTISCGVILVKWHLKYCSFSSGVWNPHWCRSSGFSNVPVDPLSQSGLVSLGAGRWTLGEAGRKSLVTPIILWGRNELLSFGREYTVSVGICLYYLLISASKLSPKLDRELQSSSCLPWWELQVLSLLGGDWISLWEDRVSMKWIWNTGSKPK